MSFENQKLMTRRVRSSNILTSVAFDHLVMEGPKDIGAGHEVP